ncbi:MAG: hypothetical protein KAJ73_06870 [Zetaproteobacteria bacterium]|nr:hypothetical protein [Zetaproteobacteria bacterium]
MSDYFECTVEVDSTTDKKAKENSFTVVLKGSAYVTLETESGYTWTESVEVTHTVKCESMRMAEQLGIDERGLTKIVGLRNRALSFDEPISVEVSLAKGV